MCVYVRVRLWGAPGGGGARTHGQKQIIDLNTNYGTRIAALDSKSMTQSKMSALQCVRFPRLVCKMLSGTNLVRHM